MQAEEIAQRMAAWSGSPEIQVRQTRFRMELARIWGIAPQERILEIGCGQGDMTAVLSAMGASVLAVDPADPRYGAPVSLGESTRHLAATDLGERLEFRLAFDPLAASFPRDAFDTVIMAHCSWYFASTEVLLQTLKAVRPWARRLCFSEWDLRPTSGGELAHLVAILIQGQVEAYRPVSESNVRTPLAQSQLRALFAEAGWTVVRESVVDSSGLDDGRWEIDAARASNTEDLPSRLKMLVETEMAMLGDLVGATRSLPSYALVAERTSEF